MTAQFLCNRSGVCLGHVPSLNRRAFLSQPKELTRRLGEKLRLLFRGEVLHRFNERTGMRFSQRERVIGAESDPRSAEEFHKKPEGIGVVNKRIDVEARWLLSGREKAAGRFLVINGAQVGTDVKGV
ncbi:MAG: hypothetical protein QOD64_2060, partial [Verrucomicrobiota bacterium]